jgi:hypothetical protein
VLVPGDDPPFIIMSLTGPTAGNVPLRRRHGNELIRRLEGLGSQADLVTRIFAARRGAYQQQFEVTPSDQPALLAALEAPPELPTGKLVELRDALRLSS